MGSVGKKIKKVVKKIARPKVLLPLAAIALGGPALMGGLKGAAIGAGAAPGSLMGSAAVKSAMAGKAGIGAALKSGIGALAKKVAMSPITKGVIGGLKNPFSVPGSLTYGGLGALGMMLGSKGGPEQGSDPIDRAALNQANYDMMRMYGQNAGYTNEDINTIYGPLGQMMGGEYTEVAADPNQRRRIQYPGTNYPIYTTQGAADGGRIGLMGGGGPGDLKYAVESFIRDFPEFENLGNEELYKEMEKRGYLSDRDEMYLGGRAGYASGKSVTGKRGYKPMSKHYDTYDDIVRELDDPILDKQQQDIIEQMREMSEFDYAAGGRAGYKDGKKVSLGSRAKQLLDLGTYGYLGGEFLANPLVEMLTGMPLYNTGGRVGYADGDVVNPMNPYGGPHKEEDIGIYDFLDARNERERISRELRAAQKAEAIERAQNIYDATKERHEEFTEMGFDVPPMKTIEEMFPKMDFDPSLYKNGGRIGLEGGGMSNMMMASAPDPMAERMDMMENLALDRFGKPLEMLNDREYIELEDLLEEMTPMATGGRVNRNMGGIMNAGSIPQTMQNPVDMGMQLDGRGGGFIPMGAKPRADDVPAMLSKDEFVMTRDAVKGLGDGDVNVGAQKMYDLMNQLEAKV